MKPQNKIRWAIIERAYIWIGKDLPEMPETDAEIEALFERLAEKEYPSEMYDASNDIRDMGQDTNIPERNWSRHYESKEVAAEMHDGSWVGWTYWYGGGKHADPETISWIPDAYDVTRKTETRIVNVFSITETE